MPTPTRTRHAAKGRRNAARRGERSLSACPKRRRREALLDMDMRRDGPLGEASWEKSLVVRVEEPSEEPKCRRGGADRRVNVVALTGVAAWGPATEPITPGAGNLDGLSC
eukprot:scaffold3785_cov115-Isochrysis_galbana.AAC.6